VAVARMVEKDERKKRVGKDEGFYFLGDQ